MTDPITPAQLAEWRRIADEATEGPWEWAIDTWRGGYSGLFSCHDQSEVCVPSHCNDGDDGDAWFDDGLTPPNRIFISTARTAMPALLDELERLEADNARLRAELEARR